MFAEEYMIVYAVAAPPSWKQRASVWEDFIMAGAMMTSKKV